MQDDRLSQLDKEIYERLLGVHTKMSSIKTTARSSNKTAEQFIVEQAKELRRDSLILHKEGKAYAEKLTSQIKRVATPNKGEVVQQVFKQSEKRVSQLEKVVDARHGELLEAQKRFEDRL
jgi:predicted AlkP superfamily phosphohydrolase/phosphomutase